MATIFDSIAKSHIGNPLKSIWWSFFGKIVNEFQLSTVFAKKPQRRWLDCVACKEKRKKLYHFTYFHVILYDFMNCPAFVDIKQTLYHKVAIQNKYNQRDVYFLCIVPYVCFAFLRWIKFLVVALDRFFFIWETRKVVAGRIRQVVVLHSNDCLGNCLGRLGSQHQLSQTSSRFAEVIV